MAYTAIILHFYAHKKDNINHFYALTVSITILGEHYR